MPISTFSEHGFIEKFCTDAIRASSIDTIEELFDFAHETGVKSIFIGGSFITDKPVPNDLDVLLVYNRYADLPMFKDIFEMGNIILDIQFAAYEDSQVLDSYIHMFAHDRAGFPRTVVQINISENQGAYQFHTPEEKMIKGVMDAYMNRKFIERAPHKGILVSVHGLYSIGEWNVDIAPIASSQGWIFAPYTYTGNTGMLLFSPVRRKRTIDHFRAWIYDICERYRTLTSNLSIVGHSYGTYIIGKYLLGFPELPVDLNAIILTGSVLNCQYDWVSHFDAARIGSVLNIYSPNDQWIKRMPDASWKKRIFVDPVFGSAGYRGFASKHPRLIQKELSILDHNNGIKRDVIEKIWMPFLNNNSNARQVNEVELAGKAGKGKK